MLNLLPWRKEKLRRERLNIVIMFFCVAFGVVSVILYYQQVCAENVLQKKNKVIILKTELAKSIKTLSQRQAELRHSFHPLLESLCLLVKTLPINCWITALVLKRQELFLEGVSVSLVKEDFIQYLTYLKKICPYRLSLLSLNTYGQKLKFQFTIKLNERKFCSN